jgi:hypothetical protein
LVIVIVALLGAAGGAYVGDRVAPDVVGVLASLAVVGFGLGALVGVVVSGWWRPPPKPPAASGATNETEVTPRAQDEKTHETEAVPEPEHAALVEHPPPPPPPDGGEPGWYTDHEGVRRYWDGERWTEIVWRERQARSRKR